MALPKFYKVVTDQQGNIVPQVLGSVYNKGTAVLASLYQDDAGVTPLANPMTSDATYGSFKFYLNPGHYDLTFTKPGYTFEPIYDMQVPQDVLTLGTMATQNANAVSISGGTIAGLASLGVDLDATAQTWITPDRAGSPAQATSFSISAGSGRYNLWVPGTAQNFLAGVLGLGVNPSGGAQLQLEWPRTTRFGIQFKPTDNDTANSPIRFTNLSGVEVGTIYTTATATAYNTSSDARLKHAITPLTDSLAVLDRLNPISHLWKADNSYGEGFLAHELQRELASAVTGEPDAVDAQGQIIPQQADYSKLVPRLTAVLKELRAQVQALTARVAQLEGAV